MLLIVRPLLVRPLGVIRQNVKFQTFDVYSFGGKYSRSPLMAFATRWARFSGLDLTDTAVSTCPFQSSFLVSGWMTARKSLPVRHVNWSPAATGPGSHSQGRSPVVHWYS